MSSQDTKNDPQHRRTLIRLTPRRKQSKKSHNNDGTVAVRQRRRPRRQQQSSTTPEPDLDHGHDENAVQLREYYGSKDTSNDHYMNAYDIVVDPETRKFSRRSMHSFTRGGAFVAGVGGALRAFFLPEVILYIYMSVLVALCSNFFNYY
jgi:hypothetical protein